MTGHPRFDLDDPTLLFREDVLADPRPLWAELRRSAPVWKLPGQDTYLVSDPALIREVVARPDDFSSNLVSMIHRGADGAVAPFDLLPFRDPNHVLAVADPPDHTRHRKVLQAQLTPAAVAGLEPAVRRLCADGLALLVEAGRGDAVALLADPIPTAMVCELLGLPASEAQELVPLVLGVGELLDGLADDDGMVRAGGAALALAAHASATIDGQRARPSRERSALMEAVLAAIDDGTISHDEAVGMLMQLFTAGTETTQSLTATVIESLARNPRTQSELRRDPDAVPAALEDALRGDGPFQFHYRWATSGTTVGAVEVPAGSRVLLLWSAANQVVGDPDPQRRQAPHWAFGRGIHFCIGAALARLEARVMIEELLARTGEFGLDPDHPPQRRPSIMLRRHRSLPLLVRDPDVR
ncbi:MAG: cytochrome P450 [Microthrixaceae bacterium]